jgi:Ca2+-binding EF-hand superfamily protein
MLQRREQLKNAFELIDGDQTGRIDRQFVFEVLQDLGAPLPEDPADLTRLAAVHEAREKGSGINYAEFVKGKKYVGKKYLMSTFESKKKKKKKKKKKR